MNYTHPNGNYRFIATSLILFLLAASGEILQAMPFKGVAVGQNYFIKHLLQESEQVTATDIDPITRKIEVRFRNNEFDWVEASRLNPSTAGSRKRKKLNILKSLVSEGVKSAIIRDSSKPQATKKQRGLILTDPRNGKQKINWDLAIRNAVAHALFQTTRDAKPATPCSMD